MLQQSVYVVPRRACHRLTRNQAARAPRFSCTLHALSQWTRTGFYANFAGNEQRP
jgi:hypothetical protein